MVMRRAMNELYIGKRNRYRDAQQSSSWGTQQRDRDQITGGRPSLVIRHTVRHFIGWRGPHGVRMPSENPAAHTRKAAAERVRARVIAIHTPRYAGTSTAGSRRRASHTRFRAVSR